MKKDKDEFLKQDSSLYLVLSLIVTLFILSSVFIFRIADSNPPLHEGESYHNIKVAVEIKENFSLENNYFNQANLFHYFLAILLFVFSVDSLIIILPLIMGLLTVYLFFQITTFFEFSKKLSFFSSVIISCTPLFILLFTGLYSVGFLVFLSLLSCFIVFREKSEQNLFFDMINILLLLLIGFTNVFALIILLLIQYGVLSFTKKPLSIFVPISLTSIFLVSLIGFLYRVNFSLSGFHSFDVRNLFSVFKASTGFDIFLLALFFIGFSYTWSLSKKKRIFHFFVLILLFFSSINVVARVVIGFIMAIYITFSIDYFIKRDWIIDIIRSGTMVLVICSLVFSAASQTSLLAAAEPSDELSSALKELEEYPKGKVLSDVNIGYLIEYYADKEPFLLSGHFVRSDNSDIEFANKIFSSSHVRGLSVLLKNSSISYFVITEEMKESRWDNKEKELLLVLENSDDFTKIISNKEVDIWSFNQLQ
jgi:hypothetical protein